jgi:hypothetical protein
MKAIKKIVRKLEALEDTRNNEGMDYINNYDKRMALWNELRAEVDSAFPFLTVTQEEVLAAIARAEHPEDREGFLNELCFEKGRDLTVSSDGTIEGARFNKDCTEIVYCFDYLGHMRYKVIGNDPEFCSKIKALLV